MSDEYDTLAREVLALRHEVTDLRAAHGLMDMRLRACHEAHVELERLKAATARIQALLPEWRAQYGAQAWRHDYAERVADATAKRCAEDVERALRG